MYIRIGLNSLISVVIVILVAVYIYRYPDGNGGYNDQEAAPCPQLIHISVLAGKKKASRRPPNPEDPLPPSNSPLHRFSRAAICSDSDVCSQLAKKVLENGGSAVDGALAALICNGLIGMQSMGIGGGMVMNVYVAKENKSYSILARKWRRWHCVRITSRHFAMSRISRDPDGPLPCQLNWPVMRWPTRDSGG